MRVAAIVAANHAASLEAECIASGAAEYAAAKLVENKQQETSVLMDSEPYEAMEVGKGYFWLLRPNLQDDQELDFGLTDEAGKINLNSASQEMLLRLPGMTAELAASIIDWRDEDSEITPGGAEDEYYLLLPEPYNCKNGPLETVDEILLIKGASEELLYGEDTNLNSILTTAMVTWMPASMTMSRSIVRKQTSIARGTSALTSTMLAAEKICRARWWKSSRKTGLWRS
jgi:hypothetical protein